MKNKNEDREEQKKDLFEWTEKIENWGERFWEKGKGTNQKQNSTNYIFQILITIALIYVFNNLKKWNLLYLKDEWVACLWILNISLAAKILVNLIFLIYDKRWVKAISGLLLNSLSLLFLYSIYVVFPFSFSSTSGFDINTTLKIIIIVSMIGIGIGTIVDFFKLIFATKEIE